MGTQDTLLGLSSARENTPMVLGLGSMIKNPTQTAGVLDLGIAAKSHTPQRLGTLSETERIQAALALDPCFASIPEAGGLQEFSSTPQRTPLHEGFAMQSD